MIFAELPLAEAGGAILAHSLLLGGQRHPKGSKVTPELCARAAAAGISRIWVVRLDPADTPEADAAAAIGARMAGDGVEAEAPVMGRVHLRAGHAGLLLFDPQSVHAANAACDAVAISTLPPHTPVAAGDLLATVKIVPFALTGAEMQALNLPAMAPVQVMPWRRTAPPVLVQTGSGDAAGTLFEKTAAITSDRMARFGHVLQPLPPVPHAIQPLAALLGVQTAPLILIAGAAATVDRRDVIPQAIEAAGGEVWRVGMPVDPGNLLLLGRLRDALVIGLPGCARSPRRNGLDLVLERWAAGVALSPDIVARMGVGGLLEESGRPVPWSWGGGPGG